MSDLKDRPPPTSIEESIPCIQEALLILETIKKKKLGPKFEQELTYMNFVYFKTQQNNWMKLVLGQSAFVSSTLLWDLFTHLLSGLGMSTSMKRPTLMGGAVIPG